MLLFVEEHFFTFVPCNTNLYVEPAFTVFFVADKHGFLTVTLHLYFLPDTFAVITTVPAFLGVTFPFADTVAIFLLLDFHVTFLVVPVIFNVFGVPTYIVVFVLLIFTLLAACTFTGDKDTSITSTIAQASS